MTDPEMADRTYIEPITPEMVEQVIAKERPDAILPTLGGQTALNCAMQVADSGVLERYGVEMIGASRDAIAKAEGRQEFGIDDPRQSVERADDHAQAFRRASLGCEGDLEGGR